MKCALVIHVLARAVVREAASMVPRNWQTDADWVHAEELIESFVDAFELPAPERARTRRLLSAAVQACQDGDRSGFASAMVENAFPSAQARVRVTLGADVAVKAKPRSKRGRS